MKNLVFFILCAVLLMKPALSETENTYTSNELTPSGKAFHDAVIAKLVTLSEEPLKMGKKILEDTYADKSNNNSATSLTAKILKDFEKIQQPMIKIKLFLGLSALFNYVCGPVSADIEPRELMLALKEAFEKYDVKAVANEFQRKFDDFLEWLTQELEAKNDKLNSEEQLKMKAFKESCVQVKEATNFAESQNAVIDLFDRVKLLIVEE